MLRPAPVGRRALVAAATSWSPPLRRRQGFHFVQRMMYTQCCVTPSNRVASSNMTRNSCNPRPTMVVTIPCRTLATGATASPRKRRRPKTIKTALPSSSSSTAITTRDRMRRLIETNQLTPAPPMAQQLNDLLDVATGRLTWLRDTVLRTWNPDYESSSSTSQRQQLQLESSETSVPKQEAQRPPWQPPDMDARWWFWNLVWALLPAACIAFYCEFRGKPRMLAYQRQRELEELQQVMGNEAVTEEMLEKLKSASEASVVDESFRERMNRMRQELTIWWTGGVNINPDEENKDLEATRLKDHTPDKDSSKSNRQMTEASKPKPFSTKDVAVTEKPSLPQAEDTSTKTALGVPAKLQQQQHEILLQRIEQLEAIVRRQEEQRQRELERQLDRLRSSGIHNRAMQDRGGASVVQTNRKTGRYDKDLPPKEQIQSTNATLPSISRLVWDYLSAKVENVQSITQRNVVGEKPKDTCNNAISSDDKISLDKTANIPQSTKNDNQHIESSTAASSPEDEKEKAQSRKLDANPISDQSCLIEEDVEKVEKRPWWKVW